MYLTGPITGNPTYVKQFKQATLGLEKRGYDVVNPAALDDPKNPPNWIDAMRRDIPLVCECDILAVLPGWERSSGAKLEMRVAEGLRMPIIDARTTVPLGL